MTLEFMFEFMNAGDFVGFGLYKLFVCFLFSFVKLLFLFFMVVCYVGFFCSVVWMFVCLMLLYVLSL